MTEYPPLHYTNSLYVYDRYCLNGWPSPTNCNYTGGCYCVRDAGHAGRCRCSCGSTSKAPTTRETDR